MKKVWNFLNTTLGLGLLVALVLVLVALFGGRNVVGLTDQPLATVTPVVGATPTSIPQAEPGFRAENIEIAKEVQLTTEGRNSFSFWIAWSPDADKVLVNKYNGQTIRGENVTFLLTDIWEIPLGGGTPRQVVSNAYGGIWSPNGRKLLYFSLTAPDRQDIYVSDEDGTNAIRIASGSPTPAWWLNDANVVYVNQGRLWAVNIARRGSQILNEHLDLIPARVNQWHKPYALSPEGNRLAYIDGFQLFVIGISEAPRRSIADNLSPPNLAWSLDGRTLAYVAYIIETEGYKPGLWVVDAGGTNTRLLAVGEATDWFQRPFWFPGGTVLGFSQFSSGTDKHFKVFLVNSDGTGLTDLTGSRDSQEFPALSPDGKKLAFWRGGNLWVAFLALMR